MIWIDLARWVWVHGLGADSTLVGRLNSTWAWVFSAQHGSRPTRHDLSPGRLSSTYARPTQLNLAQHGFGFGSTSIQIDLTWNPFGSTQHWFKPIWIYIGLTWLGSFSPLYSICARLTLLDMNQLDSTLAWPIRLNLTLTQIDSTQLWPGPTRLDWALTNLISHRLGSTLLDQGLDFWIRTKLKSNPKFIFDNLKI